MLVITINKNIPFNFRGMNVWHTHSVIFIISSYKLIFLPGAFVELAD